MAKRMFFVGEQLATFLCLCLHLPVAFADPPGPTAAPQTTAPALVVAPASASTNVIPPISVKKDKEEGKFGEIYKKVAPIVETGVAIVETGVGVGEKAAEAGEIILKKVAAPHVQRAAELADDAQIFDPMRKVSREGIIGEALQSASKTTGTIGKGLGYIGYGFDAVDATKSMMASKRAGEAGDMETSDQKYGEGMATIGCSVSVVLAVGCAASSINSSFNKDVDYAKWGLQQIHAEDRRQRRMDCLAADPKSYDSNGMDCAYFRDELVIRKANRAKEMESLAEKNAKARMQQQLQPGFVGPQTREGQALQGQGPANGAGDDDAPSNSSNATRDAMRNFTEAMRQQELQLKAQQMQRQMTSGGMGVGGAPATSGNGANGYYGAGGIYPSLRGGSKSPAAPAPVYAPKPCPPDCEVVRSR